MKSELKKSLEKNKPQSWFRLDNAGKLYPSVFNNRNTTLFRLSANLNKPVQVSVLQRVVNELIFRFPYYQVHLRDGYFWYYLERNDRLPKVQVDSLYPCMSFPLKRRGAFLFRIRAYKNRISVEFSHGIADGTAGIIFLKSLLYAYLKELGYPVKPDQDIKIIGTKPEPEEFEDAFSRFYQPHLPSAGRAGRAYHIHGELLPKGQYGITTAIIPVDKLKVRSKEEGVSLTEFLIALYIDTFQQIMKEEFESGQLKKLTPIRMSVPINLRNIYPSKTMRNFFLSVEPWINPQLGYYSFKEILKKVHYYMRYEVDEKFLSQQITRNVKGERHIFVRLIPLTIKNILFPEVYRKLGESNYTSGFSNLGSVSLSKSMQKYINRFDFIPPSSEGSKVKLAVVSYGNNMYINMGRLLEDPIVERLFLRSLRKNNIPVKVESNIS